MTPSVSLEALIRTLLRPSVFPDLELEPAADDSKALTTFTFATTGRVDRLQQAGTLALHFYGATERAAFDLSYSQHFAIRKALAGKQGGDYTITGATLDTRLPVANEETGEFINVECTYSIGYIIPRA